MKARTIMRLLPIIAVVSLLLPACTSMPEGNPANGERWFRMNRCNGCHGEGGSGGKGIGAKGPVIAAIDLSFRQFLHKLRNPDSAIMPTFEPEHLSDNDAADIYLWLKSITKQ